MTTLKSCAKTVLGLFVMSFLIAVVEGLGRVWYRLDPAVVPDRHKGSFVITSLFCLPPGVALLMMIGLAIFGTLFIVAIAREIGEDIMKRLK